MNVNKKSTVVMFLSLMERFVAMYLPLMVRLVVKYLPLTVLFVMFLGLEMVPAGGEYMNVNKKSAVGSCIAKPAVSKNSNPADEDGGEVSQILTSCEVPPDGGGGRCEHLLDGGGGVNQVPPDGGAGAEDHHFAGWGGHAPQDISEKILNVPRDTCARMHNNFVNIAKHGPDILAVKKSNLKKTLFYWSFRNMKPSVQVVLKTCLGEDIVEYRLPLGLEPFCILARISFVLVCR